MQPGNVRAGTEKSSSIDISKAIEEPEKEGEPFVIRMVKDDQLCMMFWNDIKSDGVIGGK